MAHTLNNIKAEFKALTYPKGKTLAKTTIAVIFVSFFLALIIFLDTAAVEKIIYLIMQKM